MNLKTRVLLPLLMATVFLGACKKDDPEPEPTLYERLGGINAITAVVDQFLVNVISNPVINSRFSNANAEALRLHLIDQICEATGGPCIYKGLSMKDAHSTATNPGADVANITVEEFNSLVGNLVDAMNALSVPADLQNELLGLLAPMQSDIVGNP
ncbi:MAG: group 1 truncated hemoglobin [Chitinophagales bacterium]|nr:group 1 truncated hemoglobin [Chitinophagales bacterium]MDW8393394.1 group 1 truncated hemoglobin [Chitinophagales bacterium]